MDDVNREAPELVSTGVQELVNTAQRLGLAWVLRPGTVQSAQSVSRVAVIADGDQQEISMVSLIGVPQPQSRVMTLQVPPAGNFVISSILGTASRELIHRYYMSSTADLTLNATPTLVPGLQVTVPIPGVFAFEATVAMDFDSTVNGATLCIGELYIGGVIAFTAAALFGVTTSDDRATVHQQWVGTAVGGSTFEIRARRGAAAGTQIVRQDHTTFQLKVLQ